VWGQVPPGQEPMSSYLRRRYFGLRRRRDCHCLFVGVRSYPYGLMRKVLHNFRKGRTGTSRERLSPILPAF